MNKVLNNMSFVSTSDTVHTYILVSGIHTKREAKQLLADFLDGENEIFDMFYYPRCECEHDCCGHWVTAGAEVCHVDNVYDTAIFCFSNWRNV